MKTLELSYRFAKEIFENSKFISLYEEILEACKACPLFIYPNKSKNQTTKDAIQQMMNQYLKQKLTQKGWQDEPDVSADSDDSLRGDFKKNIDYEVNIGSDSVQKNFKVMIEVEFGNAASYYRDLYKFQRAFAYNEADVCVLVIPSKQLSDRVDSGLADFGKVVRELPDSLLSTTVPILVIGLENDASAEFNLESYMTVETAKSTKKEHIELRDIFINSVIENQKDTQNEILVLSDEYIKQHMLMKQFNDLNKKISETENNISISHDEIHERL